MNAVYIYFGINLLFLLNEIRLDLTHEPSDEEQEIDNIIGSENRKTLFYFLFLFFGVLAWINGLITSEEDDNTHN